MQTPIDAKATISVVDPSLVFENIGSNNYSTGCAYMSRVLCHTAHTRANTFLPNILEHSLSTVGKRRGRLLRRLKMLS